MNIQSLDFLHSMTNDSIVSNKLMGKMSKQYSHSLVHNYFSNSNVQESSYYRIFSRNGKTKIKKGNFSVDHFEDYFDEFMSSFFD